MEKISKKFFPGTGERLAALVSLLWWGLSFWYERIAFEPGAAAAHRFTWVCVKLMLLVTLLWLTRFFLEALRDIRADAPAAGALRCGLPLFALITLIWAVTDSWPILYGDQRNILDAAVQYDVLGGFFHCFTLWLPMIALNLVPLPTVPVLFKILLISLGVGYCVWRLLRVTRSRLAWLLYLPFLLPPGLYLSYNIHRIPYYAVLYLVFSCVLLCDRPEGRPLTRGKLALLCLTAAVLTQWRSEGIYLLALTPVLLWLCYRPRWTRRQKALALALFLAAQLLVRLPETVAERDGLDPGRRAMPLFEYLITGMERKGLDKEKNAADLAIVDRYIDLEALHAMNEELGDYCYNDNLILYYGMRHGASEADKEAFRGAVTRIVLHNPLVYIRSQLCAWVHISEQTYHDRKLDELANIFQRLYLPTIWLFVLFFLALRRRDWLLFFLTGGHLIHFAITTALLPAAYFKYYYSELLYAALTALLLLPPAFRRWRERRRR